MGEVIRFPKAVAHQVHSAGQTGTRLVRIGQRWLRLSTQLSAKISALAEEPSR
jgi:hypothetical protein